MTNNSRPGDLCIHELIEQQVEKTPDALAITAGSTRLTYRELNNRANHVAHRLCALGVSLEVMVGVYLERSVDAAVMFLGILKAGGVYVPLDPNYPSEQVARMANDAGLQVILTTSALSLRFPITELKVLCTDSAEFEVSGTVANLKSSARLENASYVIYTSGSTGQPKGVVEIHRSMTARLRATPLPDIDSGDVCCLSSSLNFGISASRLFLPLALGASIVILSDEQVKDIAEFTSAIERHSITSIFVVPGFLRRVLDLNSAMLARLGSLRAIAVGGGTFTTELLHRSSQKLAHVKLVNMYGSTEIGTTACLKVLSNREPVSIGKPAANTRIYIFDSQMKPVSTGMSGELYVGAAHLARGYLHQPDLTAERFLIDPLVTSERVFRTGDLGRYLQSGEIEFLGRVDHQVKIRGFRIELGEVESALQTSEQIVESVVNTDGSEDEIRLVAYVVRKPESTVNASELRNHVSQLLPEHMIPAVFVFLKRLPITSAGKVDRNALPTPPSARPDSAIEYEPPNTPTEQTLANVWSDILRVDNVGVHDNFFELGGDSLSALRTIHCISEATDIELSIGQLRSFPTIKGLSSLITSFAARGSACRVAPIPVIPRDGMLPLSINQEFFLVRQLRRRLSGVQSKQALTGFAFCFKGKLDMPTLETAINAVLRRHETLRTGFVPVTSVGGLRFEGWDCLGDLLGNMSIKPAIRIEPKVRASAELTLTLVDFQLLDPEIQQTSLRRLVASMVSTPYDYASPPLLRASIVRLGPINHLLILGASHLIFDGWSRQIFEKELVVFYRASLSGMRGSPLPDLTVQYIDYARWQRVRLQGEIRDVHFRYWEERGAAFPLLTVADIPFAKMVDGTSGDAGKVQRRQLESDLGDGLRSFVSRNAITLYAVLLTAVSILLHLYTRRDQVTVGAYFANRSHRDVANLIGDFANYHVLGVDVRANLQLNELVKQVGIILSDAQSHEEIPHLLTLNMLHRNSVRGPARTSTQGGPITCELVQDSEVDIIHGLSMHRLGLLDYLPSFPLPLRIVCVESQRGEIKIGAAYHISRFEDSDIHQLLEVLQAILRQIVLTPDAQIASLSRMSATSQ